MSNENLAFTCIDQLYESDDGSTQNSVFSEFRVDEEDQSGGSLDPQLEGQLATLCNQFIQNSAVGNAELQERLQLSFLIQKYSDLVSKNSPFKIPKLMANEEREKIFPCGNNSSRVMMGQSSSSSSLLVSEESMSYCSSCPQKTDEFNQKEKEHLKNEIIKVNALKSRLESLCKDLQQESKRIKEEGKKFFRTMEPFNSYSGINGLPSPMSPDSSSCSSLHDDPIALSCESHNCTTTVEEYNSLSAKYNTVLDSYEQREKQFNSLFKYKEAHLNHSAARFVEQQDTLNRESLKVETLKSQILNFVKTENELKRQLAVYVDKFKQVEETLSKSNELFMTFRKETEKMTKNLAKFEKENEYLKNKVGTLNRNILEMAEEKARNQKTTETLANQKIKLEVLCRTLQAERNEALAQISKLKKIDNENATPDEPNGEDKLPL